MQNKTDSILEPSPALKNALKWIDDNPGVYDALGVLSDAEIASKLDCKVSRVSRFRRTLGIKFKRGPKLDTPNGGWVVQGKRPELTDSQISGMLSALNHEKMEDLTNKYEKKYPGIFELLGKQTDQSIGDKYGVSRETIRLIRNKFDIQTRSDNSAISEAIESHKTENILILNQEIALSLLSVKRFVESNFTLIESVAYNSMKNEGEE